LIVEACFPSGWRRRAGEWKLANDEDRSVVDHPSLLARLVGLLL